WLSGIVGHRWRNRIHFNIQATHPATRLNYLSFSHLINDRAVHLVMNNSLAGQYRLSHIISLRLTSILGHWLGFQHWLVSQFMYFYLTHFCRDTSKIPTA